MNESIIKNINDSSKNILVDNKYLPTNFYKNYFEKILNRDYRKTSIEYKKNFETELITEEDVNTNFDLLLEQIKMYESEDIKKIVGIGKQLIIDTFDIPSDIVNFECEISEDTLYDKDIINEDEYEYYDFEDYNQINELSDKLSKYSLIKPLMCGAARNSLKLLNKVEDEISEHNPVLYSKYKKLVSLMNHSPYIYGYSDNSYIMGDNDISIEKNEDGTKKCTIKAKACCLPALIYEMTLGVFKYIVSNALMKDDDFNYVNNNIKINQTNYYDEILGKCLWLDMVRDINEYDNKLDNHILYELTQCEPSTFENFKEVFAHTKKGKEYMNFIYESIKNELETEDEYVDINDITINDVI